MRAGYGIYYDRGELFSYFSPSAGSGLQWSLRRDAGAALRRTHRRHDEDREPFGAIRHSLGPPRPAAANAANFLAYLPNFSQTACGYPGCWPTGNLFGPFLYGGYDIGNKLPNTQNWTLDFQYQPSNNWLFDVAYVGNHGVHEVLPVPFNQPIIATPQNPLWSERRQ